LQRADRKGLEDHGFIVEPLMEWSECRRGRP
jgi:hypothetical protein